MAPIDEGKAPGRIRRVLMIGKARRCVGTLVAYVADSLKCSLSQIMFYSC